MIMHIDANSFYASCERIFRPDLVRAPIAVLSNNDGITISLDSQCKSLGFRRGDTYFREKDRYETAGVSVFSSNYTLYADISRRLNLIYSMYAAETELYSIDESFLFFPDWSNAEFTMLARQIRNDALQQVHVPVSVGIAPTKTLAKMCNKMAKKYGGVCSWLEIDGESALASCPAEDVWGVGPAKADVISRFGVHTALDLAQFPLDKAKKYLSITGFRTVQELNGVQAIGCAPSAKRQNITSSRSFARGVNSMGELETALAEYTQLAVARMRAEGSACSVVSIYLMTARAYREEDKADEYFNGALRKLPRPTSYLPDILAAASGLLHSLYRPQFMYRKIMVNLLGLERDCETQMELFAQEGSEERKRSQAVMSACDHINGKYGRGTIHPGVRSQTDDVSSDGKQAAWIMQRTHLSKAYTTRLAELQEAV
jgi:DNA polymerase V